MERKESRVSRAIRISPDVYQELAKRAVDGESPNVTIRRLLGLAARPGRFSNFKEREREARVPFYPRRTG
jgi:predicted CopG family antitoxin